jgi:hypothetical protein
MLPLSQHSTVGLQHEYAFGAIFGFSAGDGTFHHSGCKQSISLYRCMLHIYVDAIRNSGPVKEAFMEASN